MKGQRALIKVLNSLSVGRAKKRRIVRLNLKKGEKKV